METPLMRFFRMLACLAFAVTLTGAASAEVPREDVRDFMERSGMAKSLSAGVEEFSKGFLDGAREEIPDDAEALSVIVAAAINGRQLIDAVETAYADALMPEELAEANAFLDSPLGGRITAAEIEASKPGVSEQIDGEREALAAGLEADKPRLAVVEGIESSLRAAEVNAAIVMSITRAVMLGALGEADGEAVSEVERALEAMRPGIVDQARSFGLASFAHIYRDFTTDELGDYAAYLDTAGARTLYGVFFAAVSEHYTGAGAKIGKGMAALTKQRRS